jgi:hypothetical protein
LNFETLINHIIIINQDNILAIDIPLSIILISLNQKEKINNKSFSYPNIETRKRALYALYKPLCVILKYVNY